MQTGQFPKSLKPIVKRTFADAYKDYKPLYDVIFKADPTNDAYEEYTAHAGMTMMQQKSEGGVGVYDRMHELYTVRLRTIEYALGFKVTRIMMEDGHGFKAAAKGAAELKHAYLRTMEQIAANILNRAFNSSYTQGDGSTGGGGDGKELCATDHPTLGADVRNELTVAADASEASFEQAIRDIQAMTDNRGNKMMTAADQLIIHPEQEQDIRRILRSDLRSGTADNDINVLRTSSIAQKELIINRYLTDADAWFILTDINNTGDGLIHLPRRALEVTSDNEFDTQNAAFLATARDGFGWLDFRAIFGSPGA
jgi:hypothetical protein